MATGRTARGDLVGPFPTFAVNSLPIMTCMIQTPGGTARAIEAGHRVHLMDLIVWLAALFLLGLAVLGLMFAFTAACENV
jgi:hypothetical protein